MKASGDTVVSSDDMGNLVVWRLSRGHLEPSTKINGFGLVQILLYIDFSGQLNILNLLYFVKLSMLVSGNLLKLRGGNVRIRPHPTVCCELRAVAERSDCAWQVDNGV